MRTLAIAWGGLIVVFPTRLAFAHGFGQRYDLPVPLWLWVTGAALAVGLSFVAMGVFIRGTPGLHAYPRVNLLQWRAGRLLGHPLVTTTAKAITVLLLVVIVVAGVVGSQNPLRNPAPTLVWVLWWVGFAYISALLGNLWALLNPWSTLFGWLEALHERSDGDDGLGLGLRYPPALGVWPAVGLFLGFAWIELVFDGPAVPANLAVLTVVYSLITWAGMTLFGRAVWLGRGDPFALAFGVLARFAPTEVQVIDASVCRACPLDCRDERGECVNCYACFARAPAAARRFNLRPFAVGLLRDTRLSASMVAFVVLLLATVTFDGFTATAAWADIQSALYAATPTLGYARLPAIGTLGLVAFPALFLAVYVVVARWIALAGGRPAATADITRAFVLSLVPIAIGYHRVDPKAKLLRGLGDPSRLRVLEALRDGAVRAGEIVHRTGLSQPNASMHLHCLADCGLVTWEREGRVVYYRIADKQVVRFLDQIEELLLRVGPLIEACPRYRQPWRESPGHRPQRRRR